MSNVVPPCRIIRVYTFKGDRSPSSRVRFDALIAAEQGGGTGPTREQCLLYAGHTGISTDSGTTILGFGPDGGGLPVFQVFADLKNGKSFPGLVSDDTAVFAAAGAILVVQSFDVVLPEPAYDTFVATLVQERQSSRFRYGFPDGDGDCNCTTWPERLGLPLLSGSMDEFVALLGFLSYPSRRFGECV